MNNELNDQVAKASLTITLSGSNLHHLNVYREAVHALKLENWPDDAKEGDAPGNYLALYKGQRDAAANALAQILSDAADETRRCAE